MKKKLVLVGNGMAGVNCIEQLLKLAPNRYDITIIGSEPHPNYNRILLSSVLAGDADMKDIVINDWSWYEENHITLHTGQTVNAVDSERKIISTDGGLKLPYDELIIATGSNAFMLPVPGADKPGVIAFRDIKDCETMMETAKSYRKAVVIGGGLLGLEAARGLLNLNMEVTVVHKHPYIMERQLDYTASTMLRTELEQQGMKFLLSKNTETIYGKKRVSGLRFTDGTEEEADLVVMAIGIRPNVALARQAGITINQGIVVNDFLETNLPNVYAVGECVEHRGVAYGLVAPLYEQGAVIAKRLAGLETDGYHGSVVSTKLKVSGVDVFSAGVYADRPGTRSIRVQDDFDGVYKKVVIQDGKVIGAVLFGDITDSSRLFKMIRTGEDVTGHEKEVLLGASGGGAKKSGADMVAEMPDDEIVCGCNGISKGAIVSAINEKGCSSVNDIKACTKAGGSCGGCKPLIGDVLTYVLGADGVKTVKEGICGCTTLGRDEVVESIRSMHLTTSKEVMNVLGWSNTEGCSKCRPALNYYLGMVWPDDHEDERESRFVNERNHANIQKDGTYSVVPRMYGGVTTPADLQRIANVAIKYDVPLVKMTGGQRIDLLGVKKEDLPKMWEDLDMPSGYAYGKTLRTVKTCVGETFCRFGTQDAMGMGIKMEKKFERLPTPAKFKMAVSGCPRNCAEATIKDFGVVAIDGGWELYVAGNGGTKLRGCDLLTKVKTEDDVMEWCGAYMQYYRETGKYNERTSEWLERIGLDTVKAALEKQEDRLALVARIEHSLSLTKEPWKEIIEEKALNATYVPLAEEAPASAR
ncbi:nitrite reductase (NADH) large subunit [Paenibacillus phyllosphaerae]|uniref:Nitrite reductase (NADH) large subunit n=1 Tax=Paenibacillus phyllosphaerae TaxID=274593 RepID=A0A7W5FPE1_9BACL|nr:nitrite reductase large subunit NirB [Paenibacillus phyllosphaerae]MBB3112271.1 nitrite reductase (NADH) large subunit [Paenibacillus phyllosphaerae]